MTYALYTTVLICCIAGILFGIHFGFLVMDKSQKGRERPPKIKRYIKEPESLKVDKNPDSQICAEDVLQNSLSTPCDAKSADSEPHNSKNRILERLHPEDDVSAEELAGLTDDDTAKHIQSRRLQEGTAYSILKKQKNENEENQV